MRSGTVTAATPPALPVAGAAQVLSAVDVLARLEALVHDTTLTPAERLAVIDLVLHVDRRTGEAFPGVRLVCQECGSHPRETCAGIAKAEGRHIVKTGRGRHGATIFGLVLVAPSACVGEGPGAKARKPKKPAKDYTSTDILPLLPASLKTPQFLKAWDQWHESRIKIKHPLSKMTEDGINLVLKALEGWGHDLAVRAIENSVMNGWRGVFLPKDGNYADDRESPMTDEPIYEPPDEREIVAPPLEIKREA